MFRDATLVAGKDLRIELRSQVTTQQVAPFAVLVLILFGVALDPDRGILGRASSGLFWVAVLFCSLLAIQRAFTIEAADGGRDMLRLSGLDPAGIFLGKAAAIFVQLAALEVVLAVGVVVMYGTDVTGVPLLLATCVAATAGLAAAGTLYGVLAAGLRVRETLLPILLLPVLAPVLIGATKAFEAALGGVAADGWPWCGLLVTFALLYLDLRHPRLRHPPGGVMTSPQAAAPAPATTGSRATRVLGGLTLAGLRAAARLRARVEPGRPRDAGQRPPHVRARAHGDHGLRRLRPHHAGLGDVALAPQRGLVGARRRRRRDRHGVHRHRPRHRLDLGPAHLGHLLAVGPAHHLHHAALHHAHRRPGAPPHRQRVAATPPPAAPAAPSSGCCSSRT